MLPRRPPFVLAVAFVALVLLAACGSTTGSGSTTDPIAAPTTVAATATTTAPAAVDPAIGVATRPVRPTFTSVASTFEGFRVISFVPTHPVGVVYLFHGSGGGADFATKVETTDLLNELVARGYGFVATESTDRGKDKQWQEDAPSITANPDLARMVRLQQHVVDSTAVDADTPTFGIGMSNGSAFVGLWSAALTKAGHPVAAIAMYMAGVTKATLSIGGVPVPTFMVVGQNDTRTSPTKEKADLRAIAATGIATELHVVPERAIVAARYLRVPGITATTADAIVAAYRAAGLIDATGKLVVDPKAIGDSEQQKAAAKGVTLPPGLTRAQRLDVQNETKAMIGEHQFNAEFKDQNADFFDAHRG